MKLREFWIPHSMINYSVLTDSKNCNSALSYVYAREVNQEKEALIDQTLKLIIHALEHADNTIEILTGTRIKKGARRDIASALEAIEKTFSADKK